MPSKRGLIASGQHRHRHSSEEMTMKAITVVPGKPEQVQVSDLPDPQPEPATLLVPGRLIVVPEDLRAGSGRHGGAVDPMGVA